ncbi:MAG: DUF4416 domain-containing protein [Thermoplasmata archaeon]|nr:MAG: DUF4416 domain-containing protein [Deltaproteobacteria bacterium]RLF58219.1 MAG: DUF4416 domain-containing protein [Thermoplasmata archaeon]HDZ23440.1 DUF4416 family protein [Desulfobacteraceae bacterium]
MSHPCEPDPVKFIVSLFSAEKELVDRVIEELSGIFGPTDWISKECYFDRTRYYEKEMGWPLHRRFVSFEQLIVPENMVSAKLQTNSIEQRYLREGQRRINIDPGYVSPERLVLATGKNYIHRIYLSKGIYADLTLVFSKGHFEPLKWTYRDYADPEVRAYFETVRERYMKQRKEAMERGKEHDRLRQGGA